MTQEISVSWQHYKQYNIGYVCTVTAPHTPTMQIHLLEQVYITPTVQFSTLEIFGCQK